MKLPPTEYTSSLVLCQETCSHIRPLSTDEELLDLLSWDGVDSTVIRLWARRPKILGSIPDDADFSLLQTLRTCFGAHPDSYSVGPGGVLFPLVVKRPGREVD